MPVMNIRCMGMDMGYRLMYMEVSMILLVTPILFIPVRVEMMVIAVHVPVFMDDDTMRMRVQVVF